MSTKKHTSETGHEIGIDAARRPFQVGDAEEMVASDDKIAHLNAGKLHKSGVRAVTAASTM